MRYRYTYYSALTSGGFVPTIHCHNDRAGTGQESAKPCKRVLLRVSADVAEYMRKTPGASILARCPACPPYLRWVESVNIDGQLTIRPVPDPDLDNELAFDNIVAGEPVA